MWYSHFYYPTLSFFMYNLINQFLKSKSAKYFPIFIFSMYFRTENHYE